MVELPPPVVERRGDLLVVRDDGLPGGTKRRFLGPLLARWPEEEFVFAGPAHGFGQVALAWAGADAGKRAHLFIAARSQRHPLTVEVLDRGALVTECRPGYLAVVTARAKAYCDLVGARFLPLGFDTPEVLAEARSVLGVLADLDPPEVWVTAGTGLLSRALQGVFPGAVHYAVAIGREPDVAGARLYRAPEPFVAPARRPPPFASCVTYDAKAWRFVSAHAAPGALFWNVAA